VKNKIFSQTITFNGHENILGTHYNTLEVTKENDISKRADCIIGVSSTAGCADINSELASHIKQNGKMAFVIRVEELDFSFLGFGSKSLHLSDPHEIVLRKSDYASSRTLAIRCTAAAVDLPREMILRLQDPDSKGELEIIAVDEYFREELPVVEFA